MTTVKELKDHKPLSSRKRHGRAINAIADLLRVKLSVPNIYLEPHLSAASRVDVFAADRAGSGDIHAVEIKIPDSFVSSPSKIQTYIRQVKEFPAHFKYIALPKNEATTKLVNNPLLFSDNGIGRVGVILLTEHDEAPPEAELLVRPERFRLDSSAIQRIDRFLAKQQPDMAVRI